MSADDVAMLPAEIRSDSLRPVTVAMLARSPRVVGKTRLTTGWSADRAAALRRAIFLDTVAAVMEAGWPLHLYLVPWLDRAIVAAWLADDPVIAPSLARIQILPQSTGDLGARMAAAVRLSHQRGAPAVMLVGSDLPDLPRDVLRAAATLLQQEPAPIVFAPATDGGFCLVGAAGNDALAEIFRGVAWSQSDVLAVVRARAEAVGLRVALTQPWHDCDSPADLAALVARPDAGALRTRAILARDD